MPTESTQLIVDALTLLRTTIAGSGAAANQVQGNVAAGAVDSGNPIKLGGKASTGPAATPQGRRVDAWFGPFGEQVVSLGGAAGIGDGGNAWQLAQSVVDGIGRPLAVIPAYFDGAAIRYGRGDASGQFVAGAQFWTESAAALAAGATFNGAARGNGGVAGGAGTHFNLFVVEAFADQGGTLYIDKSVDGGATWRQVASVAMTANTSSQISTRISAASYRARYVNGAAANTAFLLTSSYTLA